MHLINKKDGFFAFACESPTGRIDHTTNVAHARGDRRQLDKAAARGARNQVGESRLTGAGRPPQDHRRHGDAVARLGRQQPTQRRSLAQEVRLTNDLLQARRPHTNSEGRTRGKRGHAQLVERFRIKQIHETQLTSG